MFSFSREISYMVVSPVHVSMCHTQVYLKHISWNSHSELTLKNAFQLPEITRNRNKHLNVQICSENDSKHCYFDVTVLLDVESTKWLAPQRCCHVAMSYFQSFSLFLALPGWDTCRMQICHPCIQIIMAWLMSCVTSSRLFTWLTIQLESRKHPIWGRKSKGHHTSGQYPSNPSCVIILVYLATPKQSMFNHIIRKEDLGYEFTLCLTSKTSWKKELQLGSWLNLSLQSTET